MRSASALPAPEGGPARPRGAGRTPKTKPPMSPTSLRPESEPAASETSPAPQAPRIYLFRGEAVILDADLAGLYGVPTRVFNQAVRRNRSRFPTDFMIPLTFLEWTALRSQSVILKEAAAGRGRHRKHPPLAFTEHGALMAAALLNSPRAVAMSVYVVRAFVRLRRELQANAALEDRLRTIETSLIAQDSALQDLFRRLRPLLAPDPAPPAREIGFHVVDHADAAPVAARFGIPGAAGRRGRNPAASRAMGPPPPRPPPGHETGGGTGRPRPAPPP